MTKRSDQRLVLLCERRIGHPVEAAAHLRVNAPEGKRTRVIALAGGYVWWLETHPWRTRVGRIMLYRPLQGLVAHTERHRFGGYTLELSWPTVGELFVGTLYGPGADRLAGQLAAEQFARTAAQVSEPNDDS